MPKTQAPLIQVEDLFITRDADGEIRPIEAESPLLGGTVVLVPMTYGWIKHHGQDMDIPAVKWDDDIKLELVKDHIKSPDVSNVTLEQITNDMDPLTLNHLVSLVVSHSVPTEGLRRTMTAMATEAMRQSVLLRGIEPQKPSSTKWGIRSLVRVISTSLRSSRSIP